MENLITVWGWIYVIGFACYALLVLLVIPFSLKDLAYLFKNLSMDDSDDQDAENK